MIFFLNSHLINFPAIYIAHGLYGLNGLSQVFFESCLILICDNLFNPFHLWAKPTIYKQIIARFPESCVILICKNLFNPFHPWAKPTIYKLKQIIAGFPESCVILICENLFNPFHPWAKIYLYLKFCYNTFLYRQNLCFFVETVSK